MPFQRSWRSLSLPAVCPCGLLLAFALLLSSCKPAQKADTDQSDQMAMWLDSVPQLKTLNVSNAEIGELTTAHQAGLTDPSTVVLIKLARDHKQQFADGQSIANLLNAGSSEQTVLELARLNQLGIWAGEAQAMRLAGLSDKIILAVARAPVARACRALRGKARGIEECRGERRDDTGNGSEGRLRKNRFRIHRGAQSRRGRPQFRISGTCPQKELTSHFHMTISFCRGPLRVYPH